MAVAFSIMCLKGGLLRYAVKSFTIKISGFSLEVVILQLSSLADERTAVLSLPCFIPIFHLSVQSINVHFQEKATSGTKKV